MQVTAPAKSSQVLEPKGSTAKADDQGQGGFANVLGQALGGSGKAVPENRRTEGHDHKAPAAKGQDPQAQPQNHETLAPKDSDTKTASAKGAGDQVADAKAQEAQTDQGGQTEDGDALLTLVSQAQQQLQPAAKDVAADASAKEAALAAAQGPGSLAGKGQPAKAKGHTLAGAPGLGKDGLAPGAKATDGKTLPELDPAATAKVGPDQSDPQTGAAAQTGKAGQAADGPDTGLGRLEDQPKAIDDKPGHGKAGENLLGLSAAKVPGQKAPAGPAPQGQATGAPQATVGQQLAAGQAQGQPPDQQAASAGQGQGTGQSNQAAVLATAQAATQAPDKASGAPVKDKPLPAGLQQALSAGGQASAKGKAHAAKLDKGEAAAKLDKAGLSTEGDGDTQALGSSAESQPVQAEHKVQGQVVAPQADNSLAANLQGGQQHKVDQASSLQPQSLQAKDSQATDKQLVAQQRFGEALTEKVEVMLARNLKHAEIKLDPPELGSLMIRVQVHHQDAQVQFQANHPQTREWLQDAMPRLKDMMANQGFNLSDGQVRDQGGSEGQSRQGGQGGGSGQGWQDEGTDESMTYRYELTQDGLVDAYA
ncbi:flagellar hook-length control protein FliK [Gallaecimonas kandeliae]|uniref:flagellar hook-length control protein FliK n=1 Tax=Gallaecimonas kandeliae TaxID=3029055 RepID=UPI002647DAC9|nr:flagellar hook-length control protein FliK [Gallaecimonas kandeliae]WKE66746.1 flagellar hook-length control protein FliK [Gallaecimonas kandeliae]